MLRPWMWTAVLAFAGCVTTPGSRPEDMSAAHHREAAAAEASLAEQHAAQVPSEARRQCQGNFGDAFTDLPDLLCWTSVSKPTQAHMRQAEEHRRSAQAHRAAAAALGEAEKRACDGVAPDDRDISPFEHVEDLASAEPLLENGRGTVGAVIVFRPVRGLTEERLRRLVTCHLARNAALGHVVDAMPDCPLVPKGVDATVTSTKAGLAVSIRSDSAATAAEIFARAQRLLSPPAEGAGPR